MRASSRLLLLALCLLAIVGCRRNRYRSPEPPQWLTLVFRTGDADLDARIDAARRAAELPEAERDVLVQGALRGDLEHADLQLLVSYALGINAWPNAIEFLKVASEQGGGHPRRAEWLALLVASSDWQGCLEATESDTVDGWLYAWRALCLDRMGQAEEARITMGEGIGRAPAMSRHSSLLAALYAPGSERMHPGAIPEYPRTQLRSDWIRESSLGRWLLEPLLMLPPEEVPQRPGDIQMGLLTDADIETVLDALEPNLLHCQFLAVRDHNNASLSGTLTYNLHIAPTGSLERAEVRRNNLPPGEDSNQLTQCLDDQFHRVWFPQPRWGARTIVEHVVDLRPRSWR